MSQIYGIDTGRDDIKPREVRDAMITCFYEAHCADSELAGGKAPENEEYCREIVKKAFHDSEGDFEKPSKESILAALEELKKFAANFRDQSIIQKHYAQIMQLVEKI